MMVYINNRIAEFERGIINTKVVVDNLPMEADDADEDAAGVKIATEDVEEIEEIIKTFCSLYISLGHI